MLLYSAWKELKCIYSGGLLFLSLHDPALSTYILSLVWSPEETEIMTTPVLSGLFHCCHIDVQPTLQGWGGHPHYFCSSEWLKFLLTVGLVNLQGKLNSKPGSWIWTHLVLKDSQVFSWASSSICFGGSCQAPEGCVDRCCCFLLIAMSK